MTLYVIGLICINLWLLVPIYQGQEGEQKLQKGKLVEIILRGLVNLPGAFAHWMVIRRTSNQIKVGSSFVTVDQELIFIALVFAYEAFTVPLAAILSAEIWPQGLLLLVLITLFALHYRANKMSSVVSALTISGIVFVNLWSGTTDYRMSIIAVTLIILNEVPLKVFRRFAIGGLSIYIFMSSAALALSAEVGWRAIFVFAMRNVITYAMLIFLFYVGKKQLILVEKLKRTALELKEKNQQMEELRLANERNRIAREIHDTLGHTLTGALIQLEAAKKVVPTDQDKAVDMIGRTQDVIRDGFSDVKRAIKALRPSGIEAASIKEALSDLAKRAEKEFGIRVNLKVDDSLKLDEDQRVAVFRITQEGITNSMRHGNAAEIMIELSQEYHTVRLVIEDNGDGCAHIVEGYGLTGIRERVQKMQGKMSVKSRKGKGFLMMICLPRKRPKEQALVH